MVHPGIPIDAADLQKITGLVRKGLKKFLTLIRATEEAVGQPVTATPYKRPKPCPREDLIPYFGWKQYISCICTEPISEATFGPELGRRAGQFLEKLTPLYDFCNLYRV